MDLLAYKTRPSRWCSDSMHLGRPRYTMTGQDHDSVPDRHLRPGDLVGAPIGRLAVVGPQCDFDSLSPTKDTPDLCSMLFPDQHGQGRLETTDRGRSLGVGPRSRRSR